MNKEDIKVILIIFCRESCAIYVASYLLEEGANVAIYDPKVEEKQIIRYDLTYRHSAYRQIRKE